MAVVAGRLTRLWETSPSIVSWLTTVDHKAIGRRYIYTAYLYLIAAGLAALTMRTQLIKPNNTFLNPETYNQIFTVHGTTMIFWVATPIQFGIGNYIMPLMIGARDMAFPRLNAFSYWVFLLSGLFLYSSWLNADAPDGGWFNYVTNTGPQFSHGAHIDFYDLSLIFLAISTTAGAVNFIVSIFKMRAPGMSLNRMPIFMWGLLATSFTVVFAIPALTAANLLLELDRKLGTHFFDPTHGGDVLLWQHLFWIFGHPDVYIIFLPAISMVSTMIPVFARRPIIAYTLVVLATVTTGIIAFGVWVHHMFAVGLPALSFSFFMAASMLITIPSGVQVFAWLATLLRGRPSVQVPLLYVLGFFVNLLIGGVTGVMFAAVPFDQQVTDSYFVVAHFHYTLLGSAIFPVLGALYYWYPKMSGRLPDRRLGIATFWVLFIGFTVTFFPMHILGLMGMPRRIYTYPGGLGWDGLNLLETIAAYFLAIGFALYAANFLISLSRGAMAGANPWEADTLEWSTSSPPPAYNFLTMPLVHGRNPLWDPEEDRSGLALDRRRATLGTTVLDARPESIIRVPEDSIMPLLLALALACLFTGILLDYWFVVVPGVVVGVASIAAWLWPTREAGA